MCTQPSELNVTPGYLDVNDFLSESKDIFWV